MTLCESDFLDMIPKASIKKIDKLDFVKIKNFVH